MTATRDLTGAPDTLHALLDQLDEARAKATRGPWAHHPSDPCYIIGEGPDGPEWLDVGDTGGRPPGYPSSAQADAAWVVAATNAAPVLADAVRAVLAIHRPAHETGPTSCVECNKGRSFVPWPCPTAEALAAAVAAGSTDGQEAGQ